MSYLLDIGCIYMNLDDLTTMARVALLALGKDPVALGDQIHEYADSSVGLYTSRITAAQRIAAWARTI